ncbi:PREDICTED: putative protein TPRXL isoform X2 [Ceratosolen solmsi marchali]|uniref:cGMP-dependent protein kinase interacting domain-containing protein n=1 Tax=Ceratosolen solmsi marchali TaxID=326594 RepID=A0AAJ6VKZ5_9HYME|nr:PREDICTED: putative protein TPRXL isoform X2 [Ceratosolen solmsi marchali]
MSTYRKRAQPRPTTAAGLRAQASASGNSIFRNRPRSISGLYGNNHHHATGYSSFLGNSSYSTPSYLNKSSPTSSSYKSPYSSSTSSLNSYQNPYTTYGGTASGYGALTLPSSNPNISSYGLSSPSTAYSYLNSLAGRNVSSINRGGSFNKPKPKADSTSFGSRSSSLQSLAGSEGYASGHDRSGRSSRLGSVSSLSSESGASSTRTKATPSVGASENGELDYKKLYEESQVENERLRDKLRKTDEQLKEAQSAQNKSTLSETEKRERRAMERKLSEMEEELKIMETLKCENQRLKDENGALIRVISKLSK